MNNKYHNLRYSHEQIDSLLNKLMTMQMLDNETYDKLMAVIDNISTFSGSYNDLIDKPNINASVEDELFKLGFDDGTITRIYNDMNSINDSIKAYIDTQIAQSELSYAEKTELYNTAESLQAYVDKQIIETMTPWFQRDYATRAEVASKSDKGHLHEMNSISGLQPALDDKADRQHNHAGIYALKDYEHLHTNQEALDMLKISDINKWNDHVDIVQNDIKELKHEIYDEAPIRYANKDAEHTHWNSDVLNILEESSVESWNFAAHSMGENFEEGHWNMGKPTTASVGGIDEGVSLDDLTLTGILKRLLYPDKKPEITEILLATTPSGSVFEVGQSVTIEKISVTVVRTSNPISKIEFYANNQKIKTISGADVAEGGTFDAVVNHKITDSIKDSYCRVVVTDDKDMSVSSNTRAIDFFCPYYYGIVGEDITVDKITEAMLKTMNKKVAAKGPQTCTYTTKSQRMVFACPVEQGEVISIIDGSGFENINAFSRATVRITGTVTQDYYVYANDATTNTNFKMTYKFE